VSKSWDVHVRQLGDEQLAPSRLAASLAAAVQESQIRVNESSRTPQYRHYQIERYILRDARERALCGPRRDPTKMLDLQYRLPTNDTLAAPYANTYTRQAICMLTMWEELCQKVCNPLSSLVSATSYGGGCIFLYLLLRVPIRSCTSVFKLSFLLELTSIIGIPFIGIR
jgi:hypothetical protein